MQTDIYSICPNQLLFIWNGANVLYYDVRDWTWVRIHSLLIIKILSGLESLIPIRRCKFPIAVDSECLWIGPYNGHWNVGMNLRLLITEMCWLYQKGQHPNPISPFKNKKARSISWKRQVVDHTFLGRRMSFLPLKVIDFIVKRVKSTGFQNDSVLECWEIIHTANCFRNSWII